MSVIMSNVITHPSVRLKGAENVYDPVLCQDMNCSKKYVAHMHCPFCMRTEFFMDPVILKAHYRVKHVDKGIEFAGLKIVRCCDHCDIVGSIKGSKEIKGAHWHCFRCKNGFNRRDEAIKHYRTHFRNAQTTFQIQITQDVNQTHVATPFPSDTQATSTSQDVISVSEDRCLQVSVAANETVDTTTSGDLSTDLVLPSKNSPSEVTQTDSKHDIFNLGSEVASSSSLDVWSRQYPQPTSVGANQLKTNGHQAPASSDAEAAQLQIRQLQLQVQRQAAEIEALKRREAELVSRIEVPLDDRVVQLLQKMKSEHEELLHRQLEQLRTEYLRHIAPSPTGTSMFPQPLFVLRGYNGQRIQIVPAAPKLTSTPRFPKFGSGTGLLSSIHPNQDLEAAEEEENEDEKDSGDLVVDGLVSGNVQNYIVAADDMSEFVDAAEDGTPEDAEDGTPEDAEDGTPEDAETLSGAETPDPDGDRDAVDVRDADAVNKRKADGSDCDVSSKRERL